MPRDDWETWDRLVCQGCGHAWSAPDVDSSENPEPEVDSAEACPACHSHEVIREEYG